MNFPSVRRLCRATLFGLPLVVAACDIASFVQDPKPILEQTWNLPVDSTSISVASLLPPGVAIFSTAGSNPPDSSAFQVSVAGVSFARRVGDDCAQCQTLNGTTSIKPNFVVATGSSSPLPADVVSGTLVGGLINVSVTNNLSFDPLRVKTNAPASSNPNLQGRMVIVIRSGSLVVGKDSVNGVTTSFAPGAVLNRPITLLTGNISGTLAVDLTVTSPPSDNPVFINANGLLNASMSVPDLRIAVVRMNVANRTLSSIAGDSIPVGEIDEGITKHVVGGGLDMTIANPFSVAGNLSVAFGYAPSQSITKTLSIASATTVRQTVLLDSTDMSNLFSATDKVALDVSGTVTSTGPIDVTPKQVITIANRLILKIRTPE